MELAVIFVHYHTPELLVRAVEAVRADLAQGGLEGEVVVVDNGSDPASRELLTGLPAELIEPGRNVGYAGGINRGMAATGAEVAVVLNPDVLVQPGCLGRLVDVLGSRGGAVGPRFYLDEGRRMLIPPTERRTRRHELLSVLADRGEPWTSRARRSWRRHARAHWRAEEPLPTFSLSGALVAFTRRAWRTVGPFDEAYDLYFEEDDWLKRLQAARLPAHHVPAAEAIHLHDRSAASEPKAAGWFRASRRRFRRRWYGSPVAGLLSALAPGPELRLPWPRELPGAESEPPRIAGEWAEDGPEPPLWIEMSPSPRGFPAAAERLGVAPAGGVWELPEEVWSHLRPGMYCLRLVDDGGRELEAWSFRRPEPSGSETEASDAAGSDDAGEAAGGGDEG